MNRTHRFGTKMFGCLLEFPPVAYLNYKSRRLQVEAWNFSTPIKVMNNLIHTNKMSKTKSVGKYLGIKQENINVNSSVLEFYRLKLIGFS